MVGRYLAYPEYNDSGIEWLGEIPSNWNCIKLKYVADLEGDKIESGSIHKYVGMENVESWSGKYLHKEDAAKPEGVTTSFTDGNVLFGKLRPYLAKSWLAGFSGTCSSEFLVLRSHKVNPKFLNYYSLTEEFIKQVDSSTYGSKMPRASWDFISLMGVPVPAEADSEKIANFLDHETAKIDTLIEKQQQLIKLLKEKRQAVISHAVTKGLNPNVPMRDSGVEWLGEVPEHWEVKKLKRVVREPLMYGANEAALDINRDNPRFVRITDVKDDGSLKGDTFRSLSEELAEPYLLSEGDILLARTGGTVGKSFLYSESWGRCCFAGYLIKASLDRSKVRAEWLYQYTKTQYYWEWIASSQIQATLPNVSADKYNGFLMAVPPDQEQNEILNKLRVDVDRFNELVSKAESAIGLMQERRTALISAAVTGKIDVRNWVAPEPLDTNDKEVAA